MLPDPSSLPASTPHVGSDLSACLTAIRRALEAGFQSRAFLADFSTVLGPLIPHDRLGIGYLADDRRTFSVFAEHGAPGFLPETDRYTTDLERPVRFPVADSPFAEVSRSISRTGPR